ncbi:Kinetochore protein SPC24 homolog [Linum grandiflorum]
MADSLGGTDLEKIISWSDDLVAVLKKQTSINAALAQCLDQSKVLRSSCDAEFDEAHSLLEDHQKKIDECKQKTNKAKLEVVDDAEIDLLQKELEAEMENERALKEDLRVVNGQIADLERQRVSIEEQTQSRKKLDREGLRAQKKLSMYASVTNIIPDLGDRSTISGHIVDREKRTVEKFELDPMAMTPFETCDSIWKMINMR